MKEFPVMASISKEDGDNCVASAARELQQREGCKPKPPSGNATNANRQRLFQTLLILSLTIMLQQKVTTGMSVVAENTRSEPSEPSHPPISSMRALNEEDVYSDHDDLLVTIHEGDEEEESDCYDNNEEECSMDDPREEILIVSTADGSMMGLSKLTGDLVWKQTGHQSLDNLNDHQFRTRPNNKKNTVSEAPQLSLLEPLVKTTTTAQSFASREWRTAAVPSLDGKTVYLTAEAPNGVRNNNEDGLSEITVTTSIPDLVRRTPFVDNRGRIYNGSRSSVAVAVDSSTGEILKIVSTDGDTSPSLLDDDLDLEQQDDLDWDQEGETTEKKNRKRKKRNVVWMGRIDHSISVHEPRSGNLDVQFSSAEVKSVRDMILGQSTPEDQPPWEVATFPDAAAQLFLTGDSESASATDEPPNANNNNSPGSNSLWKAVTTTPPRTNDMETCLVATPNGNLAYRNPATGEIEWVSSVQFEAPVAFALDANSGATLPVDIVPDAPNQPSISDGDRSDYLSREIRRQYNNLLADSESSSTPSSSLKPDPLVGTFSNNGQLFAMPLGDSIRTRKRHHALLSAAGATTTTASTAHSKLKRATTLLSALVPSMARTQASYDGAQHRPSQKQSCFPGRENFPSCLISSAKSDAGSFIEDKRNKQSNALVPFDHEGFASHKDIYNSNLPPYRSPPPTNKSYHKILRILGSWLPPLTLTLFVVSFELGRRKRQKDQARKKDTNSFLGENESGVIQVNQNVILGYGGHGTVVFEGTLEGRKVAVKRMLQAYHASADREISLLIESDGHSNVVRYFLKEVRGDFVYLALELCDLSLHDLIGHMGAAFELMKKENWFENDNLAIPTAIRRVLWQIACGVRHLHGLRIVHRDLKPANILLADSRKSKRKADMQESVFEMFSQGDYIAKISDMGLGKQLVGQSSFGMTGESSLRAHSHLGGNAESSIAGAGPGSVGWQAPEVMAIRIPASDTSTKSNDSGPGYTNSNDFVPDSASASSPLDAVGRTSRSVDIFSLGCIFYSTLVPGSHPFGEWYEREANIMHNKPDMDALRKISVEAHDLVSSMIKRNPAQRPTAKQVCEHPYFWSPERRLLFLCDFSDRLETEGLGNNDDSATAASNFTKVIAVERNAVDVVGTAWDTLLDNELVNNVQRFRTYDPSSIRDLLRLIRNKYHHFDELPESLKDDIGSKAEGLSIYFEKRFPTLLIHCFTVCQEIFPPDDSLSQKYIIPPLPKLRKAELAPASIPEVSAISESPPHPASQETGESFEDVEQKCCYDDQGGETNHVVGGDEEANLGNTTSLLDPTNHMCDQSYDFSGCSSLVDEKYVSPADAGDVVVWECSTAAKTFNNRGWFRSDEDWVRRTDAALRKPSTALKRCMDDPKFRTRLCNHWDTSHGTHCPMRKKGKCVFAHGPVELRVKEQKRSRWGKLVDENGDNNNSRHSGGEDTYGAARSIETERKQEGKWNVEKGSAKKKNGTGTSKKKNQAPATAPAKEADKVAVEQQ